MDKLIADSKEPKNKSLGVFKPTEIIDFVIEEVKETEKESNRPKKTNKFISIRRRT